jgi:hypothetical protein
LNPFRVFEIKVVNSKEGRFICDSQSETNCIGRIHEDYGYTGFLHKGRETKERGGREVYY